MFVHVALEVTDKNKAEIFFSQVLNIPKTGDFVINKNLCKDIFGIEKDGILRVGYLVLAYFEGIESY